MDSDVNVDKEEKDVCAICLDPIEKEYKPYNCNHFYHQECIKILESSSCAMKTRCSLCKAIRIDKNRIKYDNYKLNNFLDNSVNVQYFLNKWPDKKCMDNNHHFNLETLGDWFMNNSNEFKMSFRMMHINCKNCKKELLIK